MAPYENILIGHFIHTLGYVAGMHRLDLDHSAVQLLQQTPHDYTVGDLLAHLQGRNFIFEFKRNQDQVVTELTKPHRVQLLQLLEQPEAVKFRSISRRGHFLCFPTANTLSFMPYVELANSSNQRQDQLKTLTTFCHAMISPTSEIGMPYAQLSIYLKMLEHIAKQTKGTGSASGAGGLIMNISPQGEITYVQYDDLNVLTKALDKEPAAPQKQPPPPNRSIDRDFER